MRPSQVPVVKQDKKRKPQIEIESEDEGTKEPKPSSRKKSGPAGKKSARKSSPGKEDETRAEAAGEQREPAPSPMSRDINIDEFDRAEMEGRLKKEGLRVPANGPGAVTAGVVVWNINHLKKAGQAEAGKGKAARQYTPKTYDPEDILPALKTLQGRVGEVAADLTRAARAVVKKVDKSSDAPGSKTARQEASRLENDINKLLRLNVDEVAGIGLGALNLLEEQGSQGDVTVRALQLEWARALNQVWNRLLRLRLVLFSRTDDSSEAAKKISARPPIRAALQKKGLYEEVKASIDLLLDKLLPAAELQLAINELKQGTVLDLATDQFWRNEAIDLVLINELNLGVKQMKDAADKAKLGFSEGPVMLAKGQRLDPDAKSGTGVTTETGERFTGKQYEYYPALHRVGEGGLEAKGTFYVTTGGKFAPQDRATGTNLAIPWNKKPGAPGGEQDAAEMDTDAQEEASFRGIVVHRFAQYKQEFWAGVLHTTPGGHDLDRRDVWPQIEEPLDELNKLALGLQIPLLVGGDFYISGEGIVADPDRKQLTEMKRVERTHLGQTKAWHLARNVFLRAAAANDKNATIEKLIANVQANVKDGKTTRKSRKSKGKATKRKSEFQPGAGVLQPQHSDLWEQYQELVRPYFTRPDFSDQFSEREALKLLAPDMRFNDVTWQRSLAGGDISELGILRNYERPDLKTYQQPATKTGKRPQQWNFDHDEPVLTMARNLKRLRYRIVEAGSPTNPKEKGKGENKTQLADLFLVNEYWKTARSGILMPDTARLKPLDSPGLAATKSYTRPSDHSPVTLIASTVPNSPSVHGAFQMSPAAGRLAVLVNQRMWNEMEERLAGLRTNFDRVEAQISLIRRLLSRPLAGPAPVVSTVHRLVQVLVQSIEGGHNDLTDEQKEALGHLRRWEHPFYTTDVGEHDFLDEYEDEYKFPDDWESLGVESGDMDKDE